MQFGEGPTLIVRAPGRVNLIGEHIDYLNLAVLPMALAHGISVGVRPRDDRVVRLESSMRGAQRRTFTLQSRIPPYRAGDWGNYAKAVGQWMSERYGDIRGADLALVSDLPVATGLSSSSALVVAAALSLLAANEIEVDRLELADELAMAERYVGTHSGGMDQAVSLGARAGAALRVEFAPLRATPVPVPPGWRFVVMSSTVVAPKSGSAREGYNTRRAESEEAVRRVGQALGLPPGESTYPRLLAEPGAAELLGVGERVLSADLLRRFRHAVSEADRVRRAEAALRAADTREFGQLMSASHASLRDDYAVSCEELDRVTAIAERAGSAGARLTGAGFGGSAVALCDGDAGAASVVGALDREFYAARGCGEDPKDLRFVAEAGVGAEVTAV